MSESKPAFGCLDEFIPLHPLQASYVLLNGNPWKMDAPDLAGLLRSIHWHGAVCMAAVRWLVTAGPCKADLPPRMRVRSLADLKASIAEGEALARPLAARLQLGRDSGVQLHGEFYPSMTEGLFRLARSVLSKADLPGIPWREVWGHFAPPIRDDVACLSRAVEGMLRELRELDDETTPDLVVDVPPDVRQPGTQEDDKLTLAVLGIVEPVEWIKGECITGALVAALNDNSIKHNTLKPFYRQMVKDRLLESHQRNGYRIAPCGRERLGRSLGS